MAKNDTKVTDNPKLKKKILSDGTISLYLDYYLGRMNVEDKKTGKIENRVQRKREYLSLYLIQKPKNPLEKKQNQETLELASRIRFERGQKLLEDKAFANVDYSNKLLKFEQNKTKGHSANSGVVIPLNDSLLELIGEPQDADDRDEKIFQLPTYESCLKSLKRWVKRAGINKHISWHCARHSFATNILSNGANIKTVASLLGHSGLRYTEKYTRAIDSLKQDAINSLPDLHL